MKLETRWGNKELYTRPKQANDWPSTLSVGLRTPVSYSIQSLEKYRTTVQDLPCGLFWIRTSSRTVHFSSPLVRLTQVLLIIFILSVSFFFIRNMFSILLSVNLNPEMHFKYLLKKHVSKVYVWQCCFRGGVYIIWRHLFADESVSEYFGRSKKIKEKSVHHEEEGKWLIHLYKCFSCVCCLYSRHFNLVRKMLAVCLFSRFDILVVIAVVQNRISYPSFQSSVICSNLNIFIDSDMKLFITSLLFFPVCKWIFVYKRGSFFLMNQGIGCSQIWSEFIISIVWSIKNYKNMPSLIC